LLPGSCSWEIVVQMLVVLNTFYNNLAWSKLIDNGFWLSWVGSSVVNRFSFNMLGWSIPWPVIALQLFSYLVWSTSYFIFTKVVYFLLICRSLQFHRGCRLQPLWKALWLLFLGHPPVDMFRVHFSWVFSYTSSI
jgi:hypothetical protein